MQATEAIAPMLQSAGSMMTIWSFLPPKEVIKLQGLNKYFYNNLMQRTTYKHEMPRLFCVFESARKHIALGMWRDN